MARKPIGDASDFYRVRLMHVDDADLPDLDWREDILWRRPPAEAIEEFEMWRVEAVAMDDDEDVTVIGVFDDTGDAHEALAAAEQDLAELTRSQFEERYFPADV